LAISNCSVPLVSLHEASVIEAVAASHVIGVPLSEGILRRHKRMSCDPTSPSAYLRGETPYAIANAREVGRVHESTDATPAQ